MTSDAWQASLQHVYLLADKIDRLEESRRNSVDQLLTSVKRELDRGNVQPWELLDLYYDEQLDDWRGFSNRSGHWSRAGLPHVADMRTAAEEYAQSLNSWSGTYPLAVGLDGYELYVNGSITEQAEREWVLFPLTNSVPKCDVVYVLYLNLEPVYAGSSGKFKARLAAHKRSGKKFDSWQAFRADSREAAYVLEDKFLQSFMPKLNVRRGR